MNKMDRLMQQLSLTNAWLLTINRELKETTDRLERKTKELYGNMERSKEYVES